MKFPSPLSARFVFLTILFTFFALTSNSLAQNTTGQEHIRVLSHLDLGGMHVNQMFVEQRSEKVYLFLHRPAKQAYALVDVSDPSHPVLVSRDVLKAGAGRVEDPATGSAFALTVTPESTSASTSAPALPKETVNLVDMSDPKNPKTVKTFKGVTAVYPEDGRKLVYLVNDEGLWVVSHRMTHPLPLCNSESALTPEPDCQ
jgi:hypothetical protein